MSREGVYIVAARARDLASARGSTVAPFLQLVTEARPRRMRPFTAYQHQLDRVSRSFALCIPQLAPPFRDHVAIAYLLLRVLDTIEDGPFADRASRARAFLRMRRFLVASPTPAEVAAFVAGFPPGLTAAEAGLVSETAALLDDAYALEPRVRAAIFSAVDRMAAGMAAYTSRPNPLQLLDVEDVTRYCCFVAGLVGELLTRLWELAEGGGARGPAMQLAYHFGIFLQKVNILKDQAEDEALGRRFVPDRRELLASLRPHAKGALRYIQALPPSARGFRIFCAWSLMMGATTIAALDDRGRSRRMETARLLTRTAEIAHDNAALARLLGELMPPLPEPAGLPLLAKPESSQWFRAILAAPLTDAELDEVGVALSYAEAS